MGNEIDIKIDAQGDSQVANKISSVGDATKKTSQVMVSSMDKASDSMGDTEKSSGKLGAGVEHLTGTTSNLVNGFSGIQDVLENVIDSQKASAERASEQNRKYLDVQQAMEDTKQAAQDLKQAQIDLNQAQLDSKQAATDAQQALADQKQAEIDAKQATLDVSQAQKAYTDAVKQHGRGSAEAKQAAIDLAQANQDLNQAQIDGKQAVVDQKQALLDGKQATADASQATRDMSQAQIDAKTSAQDLSDAQREATPPTEWQGWLNTMTGVAPVVIAVAAAVDLLSVANELLGATWLQNAVKATGSAIATAAQATAAGIATAAQWALNAAMEANPIGLIIVAIAALVAIIILIATKTTWFKDLWNVIWGAITATIRAAGNVAATVGRAISTAFVTAVNAVKTAWGAIGAFFSGIWSKIKNAFSNAVSWFTNLGNSIGEGLKNGFKAVVNGIVGLINNIVIHPINFVIDGLNHLPFVNIAHIPDIPRMATGGKIMESGMIFAHKGETVQPARKRGFRGDDADFGGSGTSSRVIQLEVAGGSDSAVGTMIARLVREGILRLNVKQLQG